MSRSRLSKSEIENSFRPLFEEIERNLQKASPEEKLRLQSLQRKLYSELSAIQPKMTRQHGAKPKAAS